MGLLEMPTEVLGLVLSQLDVASHLRCESACRTLRSACLACSGFWDARLLEDFGFNAVDDGNDELAASMSRLRLQAAAEEARRPARERYRELSALRRALLKAASFVVGAIEEQHADAIVVPTNRDLYGPPGSSMGAIQSRGGRYLVEDCRRLAPCFVGETRVCPGHDLPCKNAIFTVGPIWTGGEGGEVRKLMLTHTACLNQAATLRGGPARSVALAAISTGMRGFPMDVACRVALARLLRHMRRGLEAGAPLPREVRYVCNPAAASLPDGTNEVVAGYGRALERLLGMLGPVAESPDPLEEGGGGSAELVYVGAPWNAIHADSIQDGMIVW